MTLRTIPAALSLILLGCPGEDAANGTTDEGTASAGATEGSSGSATAGDSGGQSCTPGEIGACLCADDTPSTQICLADGSGFSACDCVGMSGPDDDSAGPASSGGVETTSGEPTGGGVDESSGGSSGGPPPECDGSHPLVDGDLRYCEAGDCYCGDFSVMPPFDVCYAMAIAEPCCPVEVVCY